MKAPQRNQQKKGALDEAIEALALACESGGDLDHDIYVSAHANLLQLKSRIVAHDLQLLQREVAPDGTDYNQLYQMMVPTAPAEALDQEIGKVWWFAANMQEAVAMQAEYLGNGAKAVELHPEEDRPVVGVIVTLERSRAKEILGCEVAPEDWMTPDDQLDAPTP